MKYIGKFLKMLLMILFTPLEFVFGIVWLILWLIMMPVDKLFGHAIYKATKEGLLKGY